MTGHVLDLIDNVVAEHELLSADAMRWAPDAPDPTPAAGTDPDPEQVRALSAQIQHAYVAAMRPYVVAVGEFVRAFAAEMARLGKQLGAVFALVDEAKTAQRARLRRLHSDYHRRTRRRNRGR